MMIEPIGSAMTYTAQGTPNTVPAAASESMEGKPIEVDAPVVDNRTISVAKTTQEGGESESGQNPSKEMTDEMIKKAIQELNKRDLKVASQFGIHEETNRITVKIVDKQTKEVIKELPSEKMLDMIARVWEYAGLFVDEKR